MQRIEIGIGIIAQDRDIDRRVFLRDRRIVIGNGADIGDGPVERGGDGAAIAIIRRHGDGVDTAIDRAGIGIDRAADHAGDRVDCQAAGQAGGAVAERVAVHIGEIARNIGRHSLAVIGEAIGNRRRQRIVVNRVHGDSNGRGIGAALAIVDGVSDCVRAVEIGIRRIGDGAVRIDHHRAVRRRCSGNGQRVAIGVGVVRQNRDDHRRVFVRSCGVVRGDRRGIVHRPGECGGGGAAIAIVRCHGDGVNTAGDRAGIGIHRAADHARHRVDRQAAGQAGGAVAQRIAIDIGKRT